MPTHPTTADHPNTQNVLVTGGAGYIGSHATQRLLREGRTVVVLDNLAVGHREPMERLGEEFGNALTFVKGDIGDRSLLDRILSEHKIGAIMHFAALANVGDSVTQALTYYRNNTASALTLIEAAAHAGVERFVFSSTCASYGEPGPEYLPIPEDCPQKPINPYGWSKLAVERMLIEHTAGLKASGSDSPFACAMLRYFNVAGCDRTGTLGEHHAPETHLIPILIHAAQGKRAGVSIFGTDYDTPDGTCIRDYVHVEDLVDAHLAVLDALEDGDARMYNLGIGKGYSVREVIEAAKRVTGVDFPVSEAERRPGDPPALFANPSKIRDELGWSAQITDLDEIIRSAWTWFSAHPDGYKH